MEAAPAGGSGVTTATQLSRKGEASRRLEGPCEESHLPGHPDTVGYSSTLATANNTYQSRPAG
jgi:hypothetical protein